MTCNWTVISKWWKWRSGFWRGGQRNSHLSYHYCPIPRGVARGGWAPRGERVWFTPFPGFKVWYQLTTAWPWPYWNQMKLQFTYRSGLDSLIKITGKKGCLNCSALSFLSQVMIISTGNNDFVKPVSSVCTPSANVVLLLWELQSVLEYYLCLTCSRCSLSMGGSLLS